ncbi:hypothetical protein [Streptomyces sp. bgisy100]|uniref:hypothetical protein n=1 Tax=Streptomyces sp. bgisy100 TaxID=3413783 RepID=UPI003D71E074
MDTVAAAIDVVDQRVGGNEAVLFAGHVPGDAAGTEPVRRMPTPDVQLRPAGNPQALRLRHSYAVRHG